MWERNNYAFKIIRNDSIKVKVDAIVSTTDYCIIRNGGAENGAGESKEFDIERSAQRIGNDLGGGETFLEQVAAGRENTGRNGAVSPVVRISPELNQAYKSCGIVNYGLHDRLFIR